MIFRRVTSFLKISLATSVLVCGLGAFADGETTGTKEDFNPVKDQALSVVLGKMLPYDVYGVRDIYPYWSLSYAHNLWGLTPEYSAAFIHAERVKFYTGSISFLSIDKIEDVTFMPSIGLDMHYYQGHTKTLPLGWSTVAGFHVGVSPVLDLTEHVSIRVDFKFNFNPGWTLNVGGGIMASF